MSASFSSQAYQRADGGQNYLYSVQVSWTDVVSAYRGGRAVGTCSASPGATYTAAAPEVEVPAGTSTPQHP